LTPGGGWGTVAGMTTPPFSRAPGISPSALPPTLHATALEKGGLAVVVRGPSGAGKSDLALRLLDRGFRLVADDQVVVHPRAGQVEASAPPALRGLLEVRGLGIVGVPVVDGAVTVALVVDLVPGGPVERLPEPAVHEGALLLQRGGGERAEEEAGQPAGGARVDHQRGQAGGALHRADAREGPLGGAAPGLAAPRRAG